MTWALCVTLRGDVEFSGSDRDTEEKAKDDLSLVRRLIGTSGSPDSFLSIGDDNDLCVRVGDIIALSIDEVS